MEDQLVWSSIQAPSKLGTWMEGSVRDRLQPGRLNQKKPDLRAISPQIWRIRQI